MKSIENKKTKRYIIGISLGVISTVVFILLFAFIMLIFKLDRAYSEAFATVSVSLGGFISAFYISKKSGEKGYIIGGALGIVYFLIITLISLLISKGKISTNTLFHFVIIILSSAVGGIVGVNKKSKKII